MLNLRGAYSLILHHLADAMRRIELPTIAILNNATKNSLVV